MDYAWDKGKIMAGIERKYLLENNKTHLILLDKPNYREEFEKAQEIPIPSDEWAIAFKGESRSEMWNTKYWLYKDYLYIIQDKALFSYTVDEKKLLVLDDYDKERRRFERLRNKFEISKDEGEELKRPRIPENIRIKVWQRDEGKCANCGSREKLEYDHIVPISKGGSNTLRNIELLCEECNRSKSNKIGG